ncbi:MAG: hypothetical protein WBC91_17675 [Phototrophicaceae bacterium]
MGLQEQVAEAIIIAFDDLGGNPQSAIEDAKQHDSLQSWTNQELALAGLAGGAEMAIPGLHTLTIPAGIAYLIHKMATISWGIGAIKGAYVIETAQHSDLRNILTLWANHSYYNAHILDHMAIAISAFDYALTDDGYARLQHIRDDKDENNIVIKTLGVLDNLVHDFGGDEAAQAMVQALTGREQIGEMVISAQSKVPARDSVFTKQIDRRISNKLALKLGSRISARVPARLAMGFVPLAGPIINAFFNMQSLNSMAQSAIKYYDNQITRSTLEA